MYINCTLYKKKFNLVRCPVNKSWLRERKNIDFNWKKYLCFYKLQKKTISREKVNKFAVNFFCVKLLCYIYYFN